MPWASIGDQSWPILRHCLGPQSFWGAKWSRTTPLGSGVRRSSISQPLSSRSRGSAGTAACFVWCGGYSFGILWIILHFLENSWERLMGMRQGSSLPCPRILDGFRSQRSYRHDICLLTWSLPPAGSTLLRPSFRAGNSGHFSGIWMILPWFSYDFGCGSRGTVCSHDPPQDLPGWRRSAKTLPEWSRAFLVEPRPRRCLTRFGASAIGQRRCIKRKLTWQLLLTGSPLSTWFVISWFSFSSLSPLTIIVFQGIISPVKVVSYFILFSVNSPSAGVSNHNCCG